MITLGFQRSISVKNKLLKKFINKKDSTLKLEFYINYKKYKLKQAYYEVNRLIMKNILKEIGVLRTHGKELNPLFL